MFSGCTSLKTIIIPKSVTVITFEVFINCTSLESIIFEEGSKISEIQGAALTGCSNLKDIYYPGTEEEWAAVNIAAAGLAEDCVVHYNSTGASEE